MEYCNKSREELAADVAKLRKRIAHLESSASSNGEKGLDRHLDPLRLWQNTFNVVDDIMYIVDREFKVVQANKAACEGAGAELVGQKCFQVFHNFDNPAPFCPACKVFHSGEPCNLERQEKELGNRWFSITAYPIKDDFGFVWQCLLIYRDITDCKKMMNKLSELEIKDHLTGLINRRHFLEVLAREYNLSARRGCGLVILILTVDKFKEVNNSCGRKFGDFILNELSHLLVDKVRKTDICARIGADEFGVLLPDADYREGERIAVNIHSHISQFVFDNKEINRQISVSIGLAANSGTHIKNHEEFFSRADKALHEAKRRGGNRVAVMEADYVQDEVEMISNY